MNKKNKTDIGVQSFPKTSCGLCTI